jgi:chemotaxis signal transduction protein
MATGLDLASEVSERGIRAEPNGYVLLRLGGSRYAVGMSAVAEVGRLPKLTRVPGTPIWLSGVANWRGRILAVLDVRPLMGAPITPTGSLGRLVVLTADTITVGLLTEGVQGVIECDVDEIDPPPMSPAAGSVHPADRPDRGARPRRCARTAPAATHPKARRLLNRTPRRPARARRWAPGIWHEPLGRLGEA